MISLATILALPACTTTPSQCLLHPLGALPTRGDMPYMPIGTALNPVLGVYDGSFNVVGDDFLSQNRAWISCPH